MLAIMTTQNAIASVKNATIKAHMQSALDAAMEIDKSSLKVAYHATAIKPLLEGNTDGLPTKYEDFAQKCFGLKKSQAYNVLAIGGNVACVSSADGKKKVYIDEFTLDNIAAKYDLANDWDGYFGAVKKARSLGATQILTICRLQAKLDFDNKDISAMLESGALSAAMTIKEFDKAIRGKFTALETDATPTEPEIPTEPETPTEPEFIEFRLGKDWALNTLKPELLRFADECPAIAELLTKLQ